MTHSSSSGGLKRSGYASAAGGGGGSSSALSSTGADDKSTGSDHGDHEHDRDDDAARAAKEKQAFSMLVGDLNDYFADNVDVEQVGILFVSVVISLLTYLDRQGFRSLHFAFICSGLLLLGSSCFLCSF